VLVDVVEVDVVVVRAGSDVVVRVSVVGVVVCRFGRGIGRDGLQAERTNTNAVIAATPNNRRLLRPAKPIHPSESRENRPGAADA
jgi:hypothetical protein